MSTVTIRSAATGDALAVSALLTELGYPIPASSVPDRVERLMATGWATALVAVDGTPVGLVTGHVLPVLHADGQVARLTALVVAPSARGRGVGRRLVEAIEGWARSKGCARIAVTTAQHRTGAHAFYERIGYEHTGRRYAKMLDRADLGPDLCAP